MYTNYTMKFAHQKAKQKVINLSSCLLCLFLFFPLTAKAETGQASILTLTLTCDDVEVVRIGGGINPETRPEVICQDNCVALYFFVNGEAEKNSCNLMQTAPLGSRVIVKLNEIVLIDLVVDENFEVPICDTKLRLEMGGGIFNTYEEALKHVSNFCPQKFNPKIMYNDELREFVRQSVR